MLLMKITLMMMVAVVRSNKVGMPREMKMLRTGCGRMKVQNTRSINSDMKI